MKDSLQYEGKKASMVEPYCKGSIEKIKTKTSYLECVTTKAFHTGDLVRSYQHIYIRLLWKRT